tara:strand:- start:2325 stop:2552 length:228 start_codon:yes stop_codon:yes gene_type:complete
MTEDSRQREIRLTKELAQVRAANANKNSSLKPTKNFSVGLPQDTTIKKKPSSTDNPDVVMLPSKQRGKMRENIPF